MTPTDAQRAGVSASFNRSLNSKAQEAARRKWVLESELTAEQLREQAKRLKAEFLARDAARQGRAA